MLEQVDCQHFLKHEGNSNGFVNHSLHINLIQTCQMMWDVFPIFSIQNLTHSIRIMSYFAKSHQYSSDFVLVSLGKTGFARSTEQYWPGCQGLAWHLCLHSRHL